MSSFLDEYKAKHQHPMNKLTHSIGIPMIIVSLVVVFLNWKIGVTLFVIGWIFQFIGHAFEGNMPAFFSNPVYLLVGAGWFFKKVFGGGIDPKPQPEQNK